MEWHQITERYGRIGELVQRRTQIFSEYVRPGGAEESPTAEIGFQGKQILNEINALFYITVDSQNGTYLNEPWKEGYLIKKTDRLIMNQRSYVVGIMPKSIFRIFNTFLGMNKNIIMANKHFRINVTEELVTNARNNKAINYNQPTNVSTQKELTYIDNYGKGDDADDTDDLYPEELILELNDEISKVGDEWMNVALIDMRWNYDTNTYDGLLTTVRNCLVATRDYLQTSPDPNPQSLMGGSRSRSRLRPRFRSRSRPRSRPKSRSRRRHDY